MKNKAVCSWLKFITRWWCVCSRIPGSGLRPPTSTHKSKLSAPGSTNGKIPSSSSSSHGGGGVPVISANKRSGLMPPGTNKPRRLNCSWCFHFSAYWPRSKCFVCCQIIDFWSWMRALCWYPFHCWSVQVLCIVTAQTIQTVKIAVHSAKSCCTATTMALTSIK